MDRTGLIFEHAREQLQLRNNANFYESMTLINPLLLLDEIRDGFLVTNGTIQMMNMMGSNSQPISSTTFLNDKYYMFEHTSRERKISIQYNQTTAAFGQGAEVVYGVGRKDVNHCLLLTGLLNDGNEMIFNLVGGLDMIECNASELSNAKDVEFDEHPALFTQDDTNYGKLNYENISYNQDSIIRYICALAMNYFGQQIDIGNYQVLTSESSVFHEHDDVFLNQGNGYFQLEATVVTRTQFDPNAFAERTTELL